MMKKHFSLFLGLFLSLSFGLSFSVQATSVDLLFEDQTFKLNTKLYPELITKKQTHNIQIAGIKLPLAIQEDRLIETNPYIEVQTEFEDQISSQVLKSALYENGLLLSRKPEKVTLTTKENGSISFSDKPASGFRVDFKALSAVIESALKHKNKAIRVPAQKHFTKVEASPELKEKGITEVMAIGVSNFKGSSENRKENIKAASRAFNGVVIPKNKTFSFNNTLEPFFSEDYGFKEELVIKGNELTPELGGGVCQVSTTAFRAAFLSGLPITNRRPHSFAVPYYAPHGFDAMIYFGASDLRFKNDTAGDILIQTVVEKDEVFFVFYGTKDQRSISLEGPFISNYKDPKEPIIVETNELPFNEEVIVSNAQRGFDARWVRTITQNGESESDELKSHYRSFPAKILKGIGSSEGKFKQHELTAAAISQSEQEISN